MDNSFDPLCHLEMLACETFKQGSDYESLDAGISEKLALTQIGAAYTQVPPGKSACPFHVHRIQDEMFVILEGEGEYRFGENVYAIKSGDVLGAPRGGAEYAHKITNTGSSMLKYLSISSTSNTEVCEYPDSGKFMVYHKGDAPIRFIGRLEDSRDYWEGEKGSE